MVDEPRLTEAPATTGRVSGEARPGFRPDIEGLRAVAVLAVVLFHAGVPGIGGGYVGVDVFFVISGFLITGLLRREVTNVGTVRLRRFYGARARRLLPASAAVGVVTAIAAFVLLPPLLVKPVLLEGIASALYVSNVWFSLEATNYFYNEATPSPFQHYWSLGVEEQFYMLWPALVIGTAWVIRRMHRRRRADHAASGNGPYVAVLLVVAVLSFAGSVLVTRVWPIGAFYLLPTRAWELALGGLVALTLSRWRQLPPLAAGIVGWLGLAVVVVTCNQFSATTPFPGSLALLPVLGTVLVIGAGCALPSRGVGRLLSLPPMRAVGRWSYSWYLWHWPVLIFAPFVVGHALGLPGRLATVVISAGLAVLTLHLIENPLRFATSVRDSAGRSLALGGVATAVAACVGLVLYLVVPIPVGRGPAATPLAVNVAPAPSGGYTNPSDYEAAVQNAFGQVQAAVAASATMTEVPSNLSPALANADAEKFALVMGGCMRSVLEVGQPECAVGDTGSSTTVALVGDSNAAMWNPALEQLADQRHWRLERMAKQGCPLLDLAFPMFHRDYTECTQWTAEILLD